MKIEMNINEISSKVQSKVKSQLSYPPLNLKKYWKIIKRLGRNFQNGLYGSLPGFNVCLFVCFVALRPKSTAMVMAGRSVHISTLFPGASLNKQLTSTSCTYFRL